MCRNQKHTPETVWELVVCDSALVGRAGEMTGTSPLAASGMGVGGGAADPSSKSAASGSNARIEGGREEGLEEDREEFKCRADPRMELLVELVFELRELRFDSSDRLEPLSDPPRELLDCGVLIDSLQGQRLQGQSCQYSRSPSLPRTSLAYVIAF